MVVICGGYMWWLYVVVDYDSCVYNPRISSLRGHPGVKGGGGGTVPDGAKLLRDTADFLDTDTDTDNSLF